MTTTSRREFLMAGGVAAAGFGLVPNRFGFGAAFVGARFGSSGAPEVIEMRSDAVGSRVWFDPIGLYVNPGTTVRWIVRENVHTATAYHPQNDHHALRIPRNAVPWDSGFLIDSGSHFDVTLTVPGVYDYYCSPHETAGMVGRIVVGEPLGPGAEPFDYWVGSPGAETWRRVPDAARAAFPSIAQIQTQRRVHAAEPPR